MPAGDMSDPAISDLVFITTLTADLRARSNLGDGRFDHRSARGSLLVAPPDFATDIHVFVPHAVRVVAVPSARLLQLVEEVRPGTAPLHFGRLHRGHVDSPLLKDLLDRIWRLGTAPKPATRLWVEAAIMMATAELARLAGEPVRPARGGLEPQVLRRVRERMEADICEDLDTEALAAVAGLSPFHFVRAFRESTGLPPHAYCQRQRLRMDRACQLLQATDLPVTEIAFRVGFGSSQAFARAFRAARGTAPGEWRRNRGD
jgi:AraC family transcriptional regulator